MAESILIGTRGWDHPDDSRDGGRSGPAGPSRGITPSLEGRGRTTASGDGRDAGGRATPGAVAGTAAGWTGAFYPDVLPADWRFSFYCNQLRAVLLPAEAWLAVPLAEVCAWAEDAFSEFRFVVELLPTSPAPLPALEPIRSQIAGLLLRAPATPDKAWLTARLAEFSTSFPLCVDLPPAARTPELLACLAQHNAGLCWRADAEPEPRPGGKLMVALSSAKAPKDLRRVIEALHAWQGESSVAGLFFDSPAAAKQARLLAELMVV